MEENNNPTIEDIYQEYLNEYNKLNGDMEEYFAENKHKISFSKTFIDRFSPKTVSFSKKVHNTAILSAIHYNFTSLDVFNTFQVNILELSNKLTERAFQLAKGEI